MTPDRVEQLAVECGVMAAYEGEPQHIVDFARAIRNETLEEAAKECEQEGKLYDASWASCAAAIRAMGGGKFVW